MKTYCWLFRLKLFKFLVIICDIKLAKSILIRPPAPISLSSLLPFYLSFTPPVIFNPTILLISFYPLQSSWMKRLLLLPLVQWQSHTTPMRRSAVVAAAV